MKYKYLYQTKDNENREGFVDARNRDAAYALLRKQGIRPYRLIGDDPWNWRPWAVGVGFAVLFVAFAVSTYFAITGNMRRHGHLGDDMALTAEEADAFRERAELAVYRAPEAYRYHVWRSVNARLAELDIEPIPKPEGMREEDPVFESESKCE